MHLLAHKKLAHLQHESPSCIGLKPTDTRLEKLTTQDELPHAGQIMQGLMVQPPSDNNGAGDGDSTEVADSQKRGAVVAAHDAAFLLQ